MDSSSKNKLLSEETELLSRKRLRKSETITGSKMTCMDSDNKPEAVSEKNIFFEVLEQLNFSNTPNLNDRKDIASKAAVAIHTHFGLAIKQVYETQYAKVREHMLAGRCQLDKTQKLQGLQIGNAGDVYQLTVKSLSVSVFHMLLINMI